MIARPSKLAALALMLALGAACVDAVPTEPLEPLAAQLSRSTANAGQGGAFTDHRQETFSAVMHSCEGENVLITGSMNTRVAAFANAADRVHFQLHMNVQGSGVGMVTGLRYQFKEVHNATYNYLAGGLGPFTTNHVHRQRLIAQGRHLDRWIKTAFHHTINANGEITASWFEVEADCQ